MLLPKFGGREHGSLWFPFHPQVRKMHLFFSFLLKFWFLLISLPTLLLLLRFMNITQVISRNQADDLLINVIFGLIFAEYLCGNMGLRKKR
jgi:hypothetical protein